MSVVLHIVASSVLVPVGSMVLWCSDLCLTSGAVLVLWSRIWPRIWSRSVPHAVLFLVLQPGPDVQPARSAATRIPMSRGLKPSSKALLGVSAVTRLESRAESQSMKIELRKSAICSSASTGGKS